MGKMIRIIRAIRINKDIWDATRKAVHEDGTYISHKIESLLRTYLGSRSKGNNDKPDAALPTH